MHRGLMGGHWVGCTSAVGVEAIVGWGVNRAGGVSQPSITSINYAVTYNQTLEEFPWLLTKC